MSKTIFLSSIGKKMMMSITGIFLVLFITFHMCMNLVLLISPAWYNAICAFLGANWYALIATTILAGGVFAHFALAIILTIQNMKARGNIRYAIEAKQEKVAWESKNMLVLGIVVFLGLVLHLVNFWSKMQLMEILGIDESMVGGVMVHATDGAAIVTHTFSKWYYALIYIVWMVALWFHLTHGVWSMFQSIGLNSKVWMKRLKFLSNVVSTIIVAGFILVVVVIFIQNNF